MIITYANDLLSEAKKNKVCYEYPSVVKVGDTIVVDDSFNAIVIQNGRVCASLVLKSGKREEYVINKTTFTWLKTKWFSKKVDLKIIFVRRWCTKIPAGITPKDVKVNGRTYRLGFTGYLGLRSTKPEKMWDFITSAKNIVPSNIVTGNFGYLFGTIVEEILTRNFEEFLSNSVNSQYYVNHINEVKTAIVDRSIEQFRKFGYEFLCGWDIKFTELGRK